MKTNEVLETLNITHRTLANYIKSKKLNPIKINSRHFIYNEDEVFGLINKSKERYNVTYSRVSLPKQKNDLKTQTERLYNFCICNGYKIKEQIEDIKSGMSFNERKGFIKLLNAVSKHEIKNVIIENKDRLVRFGFELIETLFSKFGTHIIVISEQENKTYEQELTDDLISIIHYYSMKSYSHRRKLHNAEEILKKTDADIED